jgi:hypothetical protein
MLKEEFRILQNKAKIKIRAFVRNMGTFLAYFLKRSGAEIQRVVKNEIRETFPQSMGFNAAGNT